MMDLQEAALLTHGTAVGGNVAFTSVSTDSRAIQSGQLFVALRGDRFDAHDFVAHVASQGAAAAMVDRACDVVMASLGEQAGWWAEVGGHG